MNNIFDEYVFDDTVAAGVVEHYGCGWRHRCYSNSMADVLAEIRHHHAVKHTSASRGLPADFEDFMAMVERFVAALNGSGQFWVEAKEYDSGIGENLDVSDKTTGQWYTVIVESDDGEDCD